MCTKSHIEDAKLMLKFLKKAHNGMSINNVTFRYPSQFLIQDACPFGIGGMFLNGIAWRCRLPDELIGKAHMNVLEFLAEHVGLRLAVEVGYVIPYDCVFTVGDNMCSIGSLYGASFNEENHSVE